jgi:glyoxylase-like metal-dependent hydrolase (beta-lactamase superfamily II)
MVLHKLRPGLYQVRLKGVNAFLLDAESDGLVLIDAGAASSPAQIHQAVRSLGREIEDIRNILITHCHSDHAGGLAELKQQTDGQVFMHRRDAMLVAAGRAMRPLSPTPGLLNAVLYRRMILPKPTTVTPAKTDQLIGNGDEIPVAGGISVIHTPGHTEGHVVFLARKWEAVFLGDAAANLFGLRLMMAYEHLQQGVMSLQNLCRYEFQVACFGHGPAILQGASRQFRERWGSHRRGKRWPQMR